MNTGIKLQQTKSEFLGLTLDNQSEAHFRRIFTTKIAALNSQELTLRMKSGPLHRDLKPNISAAVIVAPEREVLGSRPMPARNQLTRLYASPSDKPLNRGATSYRPTTAINQIRR